MTFNLRRLIDPVSPEVFVRQYWEKRPLLIHRSDGDYYRPLLSLPDVDRLLSTSSIRPPQTRVLRNGEEIPFSAAVPPAALIESLYGGYRQGATIVLQFVHERWPPLARLCRSLGTAFSASFQTNAYLTPAREKGLATHFDTHDVFVLQTHGSKHWRIYESEQTRLPLDTQPYLRQETKSGKVLMEFDLLAGDCLYIPRGWMHDAAGCHSTSLHLTVGVSAITFASVILPAVESVIARDRRFRESLPVGFARRKDLQAAARKRLSGLVISLATQIKAAPLIADAVRQAAGAEPPDLNGHLLDLEGVGRLSLHARVRRRSRIHSTLAVRRGVVALSFHGKTMQLPAYTAADLRFISTNEEFSAAELPGGLDRAGRLVLIGALIREGFLRVHDLSPSRPNRPRQSSPRSRRTVAR